MCKILVVEDRPDYLSTLAGSLMDCGDYVVNSATNEGSALAIALEEEPDFAVIDVHLHGDDPDDESGLSLALALQNDHPRNTDCIDHWGRNQGPAGCTCN